MPAGPCSLLSFTPTGPFFYAYGPFCYCLLYLWALAPNCLVFLCYIDCLVICYPLLSQYSSSLTSPKSPSNYDMKSRSRLGSSSAPPRPQPSTSFTITIDGPLPEAFVEALPPQPQPPLLPQPVVVDQATREDLDDTLEYWIEEGDPEIASNAVICVDACTQYSRPSSRPGSAAVSPRPIIGLRISGAIEAIITGAAPVYAPREPRPSTSAPSPPPLYRDSARRVVRRPPPSLLVQRPRTRSASGDEPLHEPLISDTRCFL